MTFYNPHLLPRSDLIETFVARQPLLDDLLDDLRRGGSQHHLLVGDRGAGKTTLLLRLAAAIEDDEELARRCIPLRFPEEQYNVSRPSDFWMNAIDALIDALERQGDHVAARRLESTVSQLDSLEEDERARRSLAVLEGWARQATRLIVLLVDNLDLVLDRLADHLWELREALSADNRLVVIGASSKFIEDAIDYQSPFYDFLRVHELGPLSEDEARRLVLSLARRANTTRVAEVLVRDPGRFKALYVLTGGTPRTLALLHTVLALDGSDGIERDLDGLLDQLTPYYKARFDDLPSQSQVIVDKVALHWHPITAAACQAATHLDINVVSAQLSRLVKIGLLTKVALPDPGKLGFQVTERFFNIWYLMRASRRLRRRLTWFVEFLKVFYGDDDLRRRAEELVSAQPAGSLDTPAKLLAFASAVPDDGLRRRLELRAIDLLIRQGMAAIREVMDLEGEDVHLVPVVDRVHALHQIRVRIANANVHWPGGQSSSSVAELVVRQPMWSLAIKQHAALFASHGIENGVQSMLGVVADHSVELGARLLDAIATGEVPALADVTTVSEIDQIIELGASRLKTIGLLIVATEHDRPLSDHAMRHLLSLDPRAPQEVLVAAAAFVGHLPWGQVRRLVLAVSEHISKQVDLAPLLLVLRECISKGLAIEAVDLLVDAGMAERWAPLHEVLLAVGEGNTTRLDALAPEMRAVALELYDRLGSNSLSLAPSRASDVATSRAARRGSKATRRVSRSTRRSGPSKQPARRRAPRGRPS
jgi:hypothetical protein